MKPFKELTRLGRVRRMRNLAGVALDAYGLEANHLALARYAGNALFRVYSKDVRGESGETELFEPGQFLLRIHWPGYRDESDIGLELEWLRMLRQERDLPVPEPVPTPNGDLVIHVSSPGIPDARCCSLLRWVKGRRIGGRAVSRHYEAQGRLMAEMHGVSEAWSPPKAAGLREYNWNGLFKVIPALGLQVEDVWSSLPEDYLKPFESVVERVRVAMDVLDAGGDACGLIHADLGIDANLLFWRDRPRAIDFDECGYGFWVYDLAVALEHCREQKDYPRYREALLGGYSASRSLGQEQVGYLDLFAAALDVHIGLWACAVVSVRPELESLRVRAERCLRLVEGYLEDGSQHRLEPLN
jgi:Ser/Thr protein kinase RdoA (MazF antagonist)